MALRLHFLSPLIHPSHTALAIPEHTKQLFSTVLVSGFDGAGAGGGGGAGADMKLSQLYMFGSQAAAATLKKYQL